MSPPSLLLLSLQPGRGLTRGAVGFELEEPGAGEPVSLGSRKSQKMGKRKKKGERKREGEKERALPGNMGSAQKARVPL